MPNPLPPGLLLSYGYGPRNCPARGWCEQIFLLLLVTIARDFKTLTRPEGAEGGTADDRPSQLCRRVGVVPFIRGSLIMDFELDEFSPAVIRLRQQQSIQNPPPPQSEVEDESKVATNVMLDILAADKLHKDTARKRAIEAREFTEREVVTWLGLTVPGFLLQVYWWGPSYPIISPWAKRRRVRKMLAEQLSRKDEHEGNVEEDTETGSYTSGEIGNEWEKVGVQENQSTRGGSIKAAEIVPGLPKRGV